MDSRRRELLPEIEGAQAERKTLSKQVGEAKQRGEDAAELIAAVGALKGRIETGKAELETVEVGLGAGRRRPAGTCPIPMRPKG